ncbi:aminodeoxychorismate/anthranilate synthase component II [Bacillus pseudomycoides]|uniref:Aminodeoxychorismate/anthranilate synthase component II n=1 Tax=Bacillus pseudomycoides TaxID=64104 RepID=A0AAJ1Z1V5_9BACI|nr:aminodeoxychorismate/anthranilate synthase component II [Bacillus pseudomycoides]MDR4324951.1 aminodeoxychorismate/anthranilate synthase component II [Bacillus pseudomycoides]MED1535161.1 aminodeoxychorismate/anthranilate synthase component II [Bacillus pseudomycoides]MED1622664.1 aminodeoxychorismate/anthranilate synthase component II [Bacillus pseudomycoides]PEK37769.1 aminodeoxychorismate/anthranilate synthase component II [Bacillus pseudomycoides]PEK64135.1 aminodeoxychorismate/anthrani
MIVLIDNYDSFTYNLYQLLGAYEEEIVVLRNDKVTIQELEEMKPKAIILSPGPGKPEDAGICTQVIQHFYKQIPILGICLGHQAIVSAFGGGIVRAEHIKHGKTSRVKHNGTSIFSYVAQPLTAMRYHSLVAAKHTIPKCFDVLATAMDDGEIMAVRHNYYPLFGLQFHPESIATEEGGKLIRAFLSNVKEEEQV